MSKISPAVASCGRPALIRFSLAELVEVAEATPAPPATPKERADKSLADAAEKLAALQAEVLPGDQATMVPMLAAKHALATCSKYYHDTQSACTTLTSSGAAAGACDQSWTDMAAHCEKMVEHSDPIKVVRDPSLDFNERWTKQKAADKQAADALMANATNSSATFLVAEI